MAKVRSNPLPTKGELAPRDLAIAQLRALGRRFRSEGRRTSHDYFAEVASLLEVAACGLEHTRDAMTWCYMVASEAHRRADARAAAVLEREEGPST
jgi:hypothetical protein